MASKKVGILKPPKLTRPAIYRDINNIDSGPVEAAFTALTGGTRVSHRLEYFTFLEAVRCVLVPTAERTGWLAKMTAHVSQQSKGQQLNWALLKIRSYGGGATLDPDQVRSLLLVHDQRFANLTDAQVRNAFAKWKPNKKRGATNHSPITVLAELCLACKAFGYVPRPTTQHAHDLERVAKAIRTAVERVLSKYTP